jgi:hypothetical protein
MYTAISIKIVPAAFRARIRLFRFARVTTLIEIAVCNDNYFLSDAKIKFIKIPMLLAN